MKLTDDVRTVLTERTAIDGSRLVLTGPRMDPALYGRVNDVLEAVGGRWSTAEQAHIFQTPAAGALAPVLTAGEVTTLREKRSQAQFFPTPGPVVRRLIELADVRPGMEVLEPSAGSGAIASALVEAGAVVDCIERDPGYAALLADVGVARVTVADFLSIRPVPRYDRVVMNPPFTKGADIEHVEHAFRLLNPSGRLVAVMSRTAVEFPGRTARFRELVESRHGTVELVDAGAFRASGTGVATMIVTIPAARPEDAPATVWPSETVPAAEPDAGFGDPKELAEQICADLRTALTEFEAVAATLGGRGSR